jgi:cellulose synthase/poly-beta-1,6-N-acetylglucosamine synthase-like glycosyltransferase
MALVVLVPAHNEEDQIEETLFSLLRQNLCPDRIVVVSDNSKDATVSIATSVAGTPEAFGRIVVMETVSNTHKKSGALNQAWLTHAQDADYVFTMDADTVLAEDFFDRAVRLMDTSAVAAACACPMLKPMPSELGFWGRMLWRMGKNDFGGYMRMLCRWKMRPEVLFGYGSIFRQSSLREVAELRGIPWDVNSIVEDYRITLDLRAMGHELAIIPGANAYTDVPTTMRELWRQRIRWAGGTWQELRREGFNSRTWRVWFSSMGSLGSMTLRTVAVGLWIIVLALGLPIALNPIWLIPIGVGILNQLDITRYTHGSDRGDRLLALTIVPLELMSIVREAWTFASLIVVASKRHLIW